jgi:hypothetical protein
VGAINDGIGNEIRDPFPGVSAGTHSGAAGSSPPRPSPPGAALSGDSGIPGSGVTAPLEALAGQGHTNTVLPGQSSPSVIMPVDETGLTSTGAGRGSMDHWNRHDYQQEPGG